MQENNTKISPIKENILAYLKYKGITKYRFYKDTGVSKGTLDNDSGITEESMAKFFTYAKDVNPTWLLTGEGPMFKEGEKESNIVREPVIMYGGVGNPIPLVDNDAAAGLGTDSFSINDSNVVDYYVVPDFNDIQFMIRVRGSSMEPKYNSGDVVACRILHDPSFIQWNRVYLIATRDQGILIKKLCQSEKDDHYMCVSENRDFGSFDIPVLEITGIALVVGGICME